MTTYSWSSKVRIPCEATGLTDLKLACIVDISHKLRYVAGLRSFEKVLVSESSDGIRKFSHLEVRVGE